MESPVLRIQDFMSVRGRGRHVATLRKLLDPRPTSAVIDIGGGTGGFTDLVAKGCRDVVVLEPEASKVEFGRRRHPRIRYVEGHAEAIPFPDGSFDRAMAIVSFHHVGDAGRALKEIRRVLAPEGRFVLFEMDPTRGRGKLASFMENRVRRHGLRFFEPEALESSLQDAGFRDVSIHPAAGGYLAAAVK